MGLSEAFGYKLGPPGRAKYTPLDASEEASEEAGFPRRRGIYPQKKSHIRILAVLSAAAGAFIVGALFLALG